ncbi:hypothetical protein [Streptosporangium vulgare]|uniref:Uncharacterized protein n=1 Tax=Streptosporangium vulgare TaxID=46190 RepID=A0ABV5TRA5_9ACTN
MLVEVVGQSIQRPAPFADLLLDGFTGAGIRPAGTGRTGTAEVGAGA